MKMTKLMFVGAVAALLAVSCADKVEKPVEALTPVTFEKVTLEDEFWLPRLKTQKETLVPFEVTFVEAPSFEWDQPVMEEFPMDGIMYDEFGNPIDPMAAEEGLSQTQMLLIGGGVVVLVLAAVLVIRKRKKAKELEDDDENF